MEDVSYKIAAIGDKIDFPVRENYINDAYSTICGTIDLDLEFSVTRPVEVNLGIFKDGIIVEVSKILSF